jgi:RecB family exonuclease
MGNAYKTALIEYGTKMTSEMKKECYQMVNQYLKIVSDKKINNFSENILAVEKTFFYNLQDKVIINGMIDKVSLDADNVLRVSDYKTTKNKKYLKDDYFQLMTYGYILLKENPEIKKIRGSYILLRHNFEEITQEFSAAELMTMEQTYLDYADKIQSEKDFTANPTFLCRYCDHSEICVEGKQMLKPENVFGEVQW